MSLHIGAPVATRRDMFKPFKENFTQQKADFSNWTGATCISHFSVSMIKEKFHTDQDNYTEGRGLGGGGREITVSEGRAHQGQESWQQTSWPELKSSHSRLNA